MKKAAVLFGLLLTLASFCTVFADEIEVWDAMGTGRSKSQTDLTDCCFASRGICIRKMCINICSEKGGIAVARCSECKKTQK